MKRAAISIAVFLALGEVSATKLHQKTFSNLQALDNTDETEFNDQSKMVDKDVAIFTKDLLSKQD